jgi:DNA-binding Xre family transcriptional regulator
MLTKLFKKKEKVTKTNVTKTNVEKLGSNELKTVAGGATEGARVPFGTNACGLSN